MTKSTGLAAHYASWRAMHYALFAIGLLAFILVLLFLPETLISNGSAATDPSATGPERRRSFVWLNPFKSLGLLRSPNLMAVVNQLPLFPPLMR